jgi:pyruvate/2-oxoglutarate dehydrogenase complex dihydrolipoamide acyltransferase (E2) component
MAKDYVMPKLAMAMNEGTVNEWLFKEGDYVEEGAPIAVVETEKVSYDVESPQSGYLHIIVAEGETVPVEVPIAQFAETEEECAALNAGDAPANSTAAPPATATDQLVKPAVASPGTGGRIVASPLAKKIARDAGFDLSAVAGTGPGGRIVKRDVLLALETGVSTVNAPTATGPLVEKLRIPMKGTVRATIARRMVDSLQTAAQLSSSWESDITRLIKARKRYVAMEEQLGTRVSMNAFLIKALACALRQVPAANASIVGDDIVIYENINVGIAIALPGETQYDSKLLVPVLKGVEHMGVIEIDKGMKALFEKARSGQLSADDMSHSTVAFSSTAGLSPPGMQSTPILNLPNALLIGPATPQEKPIVHKGKVKIRTILPISLTFDHRVLDGSPIARLAKHMHDCLENPELMLA